MRKFIITSLEFEGNISLTYNDRETIVEINLINAIISKIRLQRFFEHLPKTINDLPFYSQRSINDTIVEVDFVITFEMFWKEYPFHRNMFRVQKVWDKMSKTDQVKAYYNVKDYSWYLDKYDWCSPMIGDRYLRERQFETDWKKLRP